MKIVFESRVLKPIGAGHEIASNVYKKLKNMEPG